jgi:riboflavin synthase
MFTGLVEDLGTIAAIEPRPAGVRVTVSTKFDAADLEHGASIAVDGACLTVIDAGPGRFSADVSAETLARTTLGARRPGDRVNLERPMALGDRLGGHLVLGHVDGVGKILARERVGEAERVLVEVPLDLAPLVVEKGSICLDGISLTVNALPAPDQVALMLIPETLRATTWGAKRAGEPVNVEADILGKHVARLLQFKEKPHG